jgi:hypothetical protein
MSFLSNSNYFFILFNFTLSSLITVNLSDLHIFSHLFLRIFTYLLALINRSKPFLLATSRYFIAFTFILQRADRAIV